MISVRLLVSGENNYTNEYVDYWYLSNIAYTNSKTATTSTPIPIPADLKLNLIYPCTPQHIKKYSSQRLRWVTETPEIYQRYIRPYMHQCRLDGRLDWIFNILDGRAEQDEIILRLQPSSPPSTSPDIEEIGFILSPDLNWDRRTLSSLHLLAIPNRRDIWSLRDLRIRHLPWLLSMRSIILDSATRLYGPGTPLGGTHGLERDELKLYVHYQPTYYHFHIHVVHVMCEAGSTQSVGKAVGFDSILDTLRVWKEEDGCGGEVGMDRVSLSYHVGERSEVWEKVFGPLKEGRAPVVSNANTGGGGR